jgi:hypothetical protein
MAMKQMENAEEPRSNATGCPMTAHLATFKNAQPSRKGKLTFTAPEKPGTTPMSAPSPATH